MLHFWLSSVNQKRCCLSSPVTRPTNGLFINMRWASPVSRVSLAHALFLEIFSLCLRLCRWSIRHFEVARKTGSRWLSKCIVGLFWATHFQHGGKFVPQNSPTMHHLDPISRPISKWRMNGDGTELDESFTRRDHTHRTSYRSGWPGGFGTLILIFTSEYLLPSLFAFRHRFYSFTPATVQSYPHFDSDVNQ